MSPQEREYYRDAQRASGHVLPTPAASWLKSTTNWPISMRSWSSWTRRRDRSFASST